MTLKHQNMSQGRGLNFDLKKIKSKAILCVKLDKIVSVNLMIEQL